MNSCFRCFTANTLLIVVLALMPAFRTQAAAEQPNEDMQILHMYYREKDLVVSPTRHPKPIAQTAENISVITAEDIEAMNAHTVAEVLNRVTGVFVNFNQDFGAASLLSIQASEPRNVLVLLDGVTWNFLSEGSAETNTIPVGIIERIEIIKGPASSSWGSALGGVVNIITKAAGNSVRPEGMVRTSYGKDNSQDHRGEIAGRTGPLGYYLFAGYQKSDGLGESRDYQNPSVYSKLRLPLLSGTDLGLSIGYSKTDIDFGDFPSQDISAEGGIQAFFTTANLNSRISDDFSFNAAAYVFKQKSTQENDALGSGMNGTAGDLFLKTIFDEQTIGGSAKLVWQPNIHTVVLGTDFLHGDLDQTQDAGQALQSFGVPATATSRPEMSRWALFANDTIAFENLSITPGIRYDYNDITGSFVSPSLGATYSLGGNTIFRASVARGFTIPPLVTTSGGGLFLDPNPDLDPEEDWSYQAGFETAAARYFWIKATVFRHDLEDRLTRELYGAGPPTFNDLVVNKSSITRRGFEIESETAPVYNFSFRGGLAFVDLSPANDSGSEHVYAYNLGLRYDDRRAFRAELFGHFIHWDMDPIFNADDPDIIWDLNLNYKFQVIKGAAAELFFAAHNLLNGDQYTRGDDKNPGRWTEAGIRLRF